MGGETGPIRVSEADLELVRSGYQSWNAGDLGGLAAVLGEDITFHGPPGGPGPRTYKGREAVTAFLDDIARTAPRRPVEVVRAEALGSEILIELEAPTGEAAGADAEKLRIYHVARVEYGKVTRVRAYLDQETAVHAAYTGEDPDPGLTSSSGRVSQKDIDAVRSGYERWNEGDIAGLADLFTEDIVYQNAPVWPGQRVYEGAATVVEFLETEVAPIIALRPVNVVRTEVIGDEILIELQARTRGFISGMEMGDVTLFHLAKVNDGRVSRVRVYLTAGEALKAAETGEG